MAIVANIKSQDIRVEGMRELQETLMKLPLAFREKVARASVAESAQIGKVAVEAYAPVDSGLLQQNIRVGKRKNKEDADVLVYAVFVKGMRGGKLTRKKATSGFGRLTKREVKAVRAAQDLPYYWYFLEFGTSRMKAKPFMLPAFTASAEQALAVGRNIAKAKTEKEMRRIARLKK